MIFFFVYLSLKGCKGFGTHICACHVTNSCSAVSLCSSFSRFQFLLCLNAFLFTINNFVPVKSNWGFLFFYFFFFFARNLIGQKKDCFRLQSGKKWDRRNAFMREKNAIFSSKKIEHTHTHTSLQTDGRTN